MEEMTIKPFILLRFSFMMNKKKTNNLLKLTTFIPSFGKLKYTHLIHCMNKFD